MKRLLLLLGLILFFVGCGVFSTHLSDSYHPVYFKKPYITPSASISPDDKDFAFTVIYKYDSVKKTRNHKLCIYNFQNDSATTLLNSDTISYLNPYYSSDGSKIFFIAEYAKEYYINCYDIQMKLCTTIFHWRFALSYLVISPDNKIIYFQGPTNASYKNETYSSQRSSMDYIIYSYSISDSKLSRISKSIHACGKLYIDKTGENLYFKNFSDSLSGPFRLNLASNTLTNLTPDYNKVNQNQDARQQGELKHKYYLITATPIPSDSDKFVFLFNGNTVSKYYEQSGVMNKFYTVPPYQAGLTGQIWWPTVFNKSEKLLMLKDTSNWEQNFIILNGKGQIEKTFRPSIAKYLAIKKDSVK